MQRGESYNRCDRIGRKPEHGVNYYAYKAVRADGAPEADTAKWQFLSRHLRNVSL